MLIAPAAGIKIQPFTAAELASIADKAEIAPGRSKNIEQNYHQKEVDLSLKVLGVQSSL